MLVKELDPRLMRPLFFVFQVSQVSRTLALWPGLGVMSPTSLAGVTVIAGALCKELWKGLAIMPTACVCKQRTYAVLFYPRTP